MGNEILVELQRGEMVESRHVGAFVVVDTAGGVVVSSGDIERRIYPRSSIKIIQALSLVETGAADRLGLTDPELALACSSHSGEPIHVSTAASMLAKAGVDVTALECGVQWPHEEPARRLAAMGATPSALHQTCSGKHAGFICLASLLANGTELRNFVKGYVNHDHPVMRTVTAMIESMMGLPLADGAAPRGTDGCSIPTYGIPLRNLAWAFARLGTGVGLSVGQARAAARLRAAVASTPMMVAGTERFDTLVMERLGGRVFCKVGAEGVHCAAFPEQGLGVAIKMDDGNNSRACEVVMAALIDAFVPLDDAERQFIRSKRDVLLRNSNGLEIGMLRPRQGLLVR